MQGGVGSFHFCGKCSRRGRMTKDPLDDFRDLLKKLPDGKDVAGHVQTGAFDRPGRLEDQALWLKRWSNGGVTRPSIAIFAGAHGLARHGVAAETDADVRAFVEAAGAGSALIARLCADANIGLKVLDLALDHPTGDLSREPALDARAAAATMAFGMEAAAGGADLLCLSSAGAGGDVAARAVLAQLAETSGADWADAAAPQHLKLRQAALVDAARARFHGGDGWAIAADLGGREIAASIGAILAARMERIPVLLDGLSPLAAALALASVEPRAVQHCMLAASPASAQAEAMAQAAGLGCVLAESLGAAPGVDSVLAVQALRLAAQSRAG